LEISVQYCDAGYVLISMQFIVGIHIAVGCVIWSFWQTLG